MVTHAALRDDGVAAVLARPRATGSALPGVAVLVACLVAGAWAAATDHHAIVVGSLAVAVVAGTAVGRAGDRRWSWLAPPLLRAVEHGAVLWAGVLVEPAAPAAYAALAALAYRHYDLVYRGGGWEPAARLASWSTGGWQLRTALMVVAALLGAVEPVLWVLAAVVAAVGLADTAAGWRSSGPVVVAEEEL